MTATGPLVGLRVVEFAGIGPGPFCAMLLADLGADVVRIDRPQAAEEAWNVAGRGRRSIALDLKSAEGLAAARALVAGADAVVEGFRPGVLERLGLGPDELLRLNPRVVIGRMTGWGQDGPLAQTAGHDINYLAVSGALHGMGDPEHPPRPPQNFVADYGGGSMFLAFGIVSAVLSARETGHGQVVDAAMVDGAAAFTAVCRGRLTTEAWFDQRGGNILDGSAPFYATYRCADGEYLALGAGEPHFTDQLVAGLGLAETPGVREHWYDRAHWPRLKQVVAEVVATRTRSAWVEVFEGTDACVAPVLSLAEAEAHPHNVARETFVEVAGITQPGVAPRFSRTPGSIRGANPRPGQHTQEILDELGLGSIAQDRPEWEVSTV